MTRQPHPLLDGAGKAPSLTALALSHLARREYSRAELRRKLAAQAPSAEELDKALDDLQARGLLSDARAAASVLRQKAQRYGQARLQQALLAKGLGRELVQESLQSLQESELERARQVWQGKFGRASEAQPESAEERAKLRARQMRFLLARGFAADIVRKVVG